MMLALYIYLGIGFALWLVAMVYAIWTDTVQSDPVKLLFGSMCAILMWPFGLLYVIKNGA